MRPYQDFLGDALKALTMAEGLAQLQEDLLRDPVALVGQQAHALHAHVVVNLRALGCSFVGGGWSG